MTLSTRTQATLHRTDAVPAAPMPDPRRYLARMGLFLLIVIGIAGALFPTISTAFMVNPGLNGVILAVLLLGIVYTFRLVLILRPEVDWIERVREGGPAAGRAAPEPALLAPLARMLGDRHARLSISAISMRSVLDGISARLDEGRELSRYLTGLLIFLGLLGTFWGLINTIGSVASVIGGLNLQGTGDMGEMFGQLQQGLSAPLAGMGTAFSASLFGLAGSLVVGFLDLQAGLAMSRFYTALEDWLAGQARLSSGIVGTEGEAPVPAYLQALLEQTADNLDILQRTVAQSEEGRRHSNANLMALTEKLSALTDQMRTEQTLMLRLAESQVELRPLLQRLSDVLGAGHSFGMDEATRQHIRNLDVYASRILEEATAGRAQATHEIRSEIKLLARTIAALAEEPPR
ncbi:flagellar motor protein MotA [Arenibaculum pallidiluteum]|uniref:flagellar motor protein MotA n=1 Tax=Arenibaculum pallidiluteum TaxID=2812559 RepID=UPI002E2BD069|nr:flagellar motor protein MotA [Arenibaculum pallidiluteum]